MGGSPSHFIGGIRRYLVSLSMKSFTTALGRAWESFRQKVGPRGAFLGSAPFHPVSGEFILGIFSRVSGSIEQTLIGMWALNPCAFAG
jgi:hypothetical protein